MSCKISRRSFLKVSGCLMLGSAVSGLLCAQATLRRAALPCPR